MRGTGKSWVTWTILWILKLSTTKEQRFPPNEIQNPKIIYKGKKMICIKNTIQIAISHSHILEYVKYRLNRCLLISEEKTFEAKNPNSVKLSVTVKKYVNLLTYKRSQGISFQNILPERITQRKTQSFSETNGETKESKINK